MNSPGFTDVGLALILVVLAWVVGRIKRLGVGNDIAFGTVRSIVQLIAVGYALHYIFDLQSLWLIGLAIAVMMLVGSHAAAGRVKGLKGAYLIALLSILIASSITIATLLATRIVNLEARYLIPLAGMIVGNSMNACALTMDRLRSDLKSNRLAIETSLALGKSWRLASHEYVRNATRAGIMSILNFLKTVGIVALPGAMTGMILGGAEPLEAVCLQLVVGYMLLASNTISSVVGAELTVRKHFTRHHQLRSNV